MFAIEAHPIRMKEIFLELVIREVPPSLCENLYLMDEKYEFAIPSLIEIEHTASHNQRLSCSCRHIEEERLTSCHISLFPQPDKVLHCLYLIGSQLLRWMDIVGDGVWKRILPKCLILIISPYF